MKGNLILLLLFTLYFTTQAQEWSEPVNVSNMEGTDYFPDFCIDGNGVIHCVWAHHYGGEHIKVFYAKSEDQGATWSEAEDVSQNSSMSCMRPHIVTDNQNRLFVSYDYDSFSTTQSLIGMKIFDGVGWSQMDTVSVGMPGARKNWLVIDGNDQVYCFWYHDMNYGSVYYRIRSLGQWGEIETPFDNNDFYATSDVCVDGDNNVHLSGLYREYGHNYEDVRTFYCKLVGSSWIGFYLFGDDQCIETAIDTDEAQNPHVCWKQYTSNSIPPNDGTVYSGYDGTSWTEPELIVEDPFNQRCQVVNNKVYIMNLEKDGDLNNVVMYEKDPLGNWIGEVVISAEVIAHEKFISTALRHHVILYGKIDNNNLEVFYLDKVIDTATIMNESPKFSINGLKIYPNPFSESTHVIFNVLKPGVADVAVYELSGKRIATLTRNYKIPGEHQVTWDGKDDEGNRVNNGLYLVRLRHGRNILTRSVEYIR
jgi:hypothetical protein